MVLKLNDTSSDNIPGEKETIENILFHICRILNNKVSTAYFVKRVDLTELWSVITGFKTSINKTDWKNCLLVLKMCLFVLHIHCALGQILQITEVCDISHKNPT